MSNDVRSDCPNRAGSPTKSTPDPPGPPGLTSSDPIFCPEAGIRLSAISMLPSPGSCQESGADAVAHWKPSPHSVHSSDWP